MSGTLRIIAILLFCINIAPGQKEEDFSGLWRLDPSRSEIRETPVPPDAFLKVEQTAASVRVSGASEEAGPFITRTYPLDGKEAAHRAGVSSLSTKTKWEGAALLVNTLVSGPQSYTVMERWKKSRDGSTLTIRRTVVRLGGEVESTLVYQNPDAKSPEPEPAPEPRMPEPRMITRSQPAMSQPGMLRAPAEPATQMDYVVDSGTRVLLRLVNSVNTKHAAPGDRVYLETAYPVISNGRIIIPRGSYVTGTITESQRAGRVKGKSSLNLRFDTLTLPNGVSRDFRLRMGSVDTRGDLDREEGKIKGEGNKGGDARTVGETTAAGASVGTLAGAASGHYGMGAGIGAAAGAAAGLAGILASRGPDVVLQAGTTMEMVIERELRFTPAELSGVR